MGRNFRDDSDVGSTVWFMSGRCMLGWMDVVCKNTELALSAVHDIFEYASCYVPYVSNV